MFISWQQKAVEHTVTKYSHAQQSASVVTRRQGRHGMNTHVVKIANRECSCGKWNQFGIPCSHAQKKIPTTRLSSSILKKSNHPPTELEEKSLQHHQLLPVTDVAAAILSWKRRHQINNKKKSRSSMDNIVDSLSSAYQEFIAAAAGVLEAKESSGGQKTPATDAALENFKQRWELFRVACDQAEEFVESVKQRIGSECLVDEATGSVAAKPGQPVPSGLPPISAVRLEQMSKAVRWLVIELQQGSGAGGGASHANTNAPFDARFTEDAAQQPILNLHGISLPPSYISFGWIQRVRFLFMGLELPSHCRVARQLKVVRVNLQIVKTVEFQFSLQSMCVIDDNTIKNGVQAHLRLVILGFAYSGILSIFLCDWYFVAGLMKTLESFLISSGLSIGLRNVCLCDKEGVLKISQEALNYG
ncbi:UNVERIFIED_CONTAM: Mediator of RNA polymerase II transcription subunit [Sesamum calycinum]